MTPGPAGLATPGLVLGPFYPVQQPTDADHRLWRRDGVPQGARLMCFGGRVCTCDEQPASGVIVEVWHADPVGRYPHPSAARSKHVDPSFVGYGRVCTDADGRFEFVSLVPGGYQAGESRRAVHLHIQITGRSERLVTQVFLPSDPTRFEDRWFRVAPRPEMLLAKVVVDEIDALHLEWTAFLALG